jgi:hypothetical protein
VSNGYSACLVNFSKNFIICSIRDLPYNAWSER